MKIKNIFSITLLIAALVLAESNSLQDTCDSYCYRVVSPVLEQTAILQKQIQAHNAIQENDINTRLGNIENQLMRRTECKPKLNDPPNGFRKIGSKYYYIEYKEEVNWFAAAHRCHELGGHLTSLQNKQEFDDLKAQLNPNRNYWIDINDLAKEGQFQSLTTGRAAPYLSWKDSSHPDNWKNEEHCVHIGAYNMLMNDIKCDSLFYFVCESFE